MLTYCMRKRLFLLSREPLKAAVSPQQRRCESGGSVLDLQHFVSSGGTGRRSTYGPLGTELKRNVLQQWWTAVVSLQPQVFGISTPCSSTERRTLKTEDGEALGEQLKLFQHDQSLRTSLLQGALEQFVPSLELLNKKLPFGLAEIGLCYQPEPERAGTSGCFSEVTKASLVWFCSFRTSSQWLDYWARQRLQWWRKFALGPSDFSVCDVLSEELEEGASRGVKVLYQFPSGSETLETLWSFGDTKLLKTHHGSRAKLQCREGRTSVVPHVLSVSANMDKGVLAFLYNSLQPVQKVDSKQRLHQRKVLKLHPTLAPVKVALDMGRGSTSELRQVCEGLLQEFLEAGIYSWPGYLDSTYSSMQSLHAKYDEMGVLFTVLITDITLENGLLMVRNRNTTVKETMHISEIKQFLLKYISAAENI
ncbi:DNA polymerase subunit gamma-2, mitochondrial [Pygocentrus nattereri]|uniref:Anticodon-binding domain-containing protein n=1 Tax=Pygocentrus nattereri TaxID=42514 RepID=A0A3B4DG71_PYGNA|nr:DNA polymerase subunit gamma-2, mitochondrial [Pygocentrus nattereri]